MERVGDLRACGISEQAHSFRNKGQAHLQLETALSSSDGTAARTSEIPGSPSFLTVLPAPHPSAPKSCSREGQEAMERSHSGWMTSLWSGLVGKARTDGDEVREFGWWWGQGVLQRRGVDRVQSEAEGRPDDQNHTAQTREAGQSSQTGLSQGHGERFGCWTRDREEACGQDATVNVQQLAEVTAIRRTRDDPLNRAERQRRFIQR